ncbi:hypothetical protein [Bordetella genomosp. 8]|nr:hypothetical protein [Bordetella genomosp. 8]
MGFRDVDMEEKLEEKRRPWAALRDGAGRKGGATDALRYGNTVVRGG